MTQRIQIRGVRQEHLLARSDVRFRVILREECLALEVGGPQVMRAQLSFLLEATRWPVLDLRVLPKLPASESLLGALSAFTLLRLPQVQISDVVYMDNLQGQFFLEEEGPVQRHEHFFKHFWGQTLDPDRSKAFIAAKLREF